jgi:hypothetical protein
VDDVAPGLSRFRHNAVLNGLGRAYHVGLVAVPVELHDGRLAIPPLYARTRTVDMSLVLLLAALLTCARALFTFVRPRRLPMAASAAWRFVGFAVGYVTVISIATEYGENSRFRTMIDPLLIGIAIAQIVALCEHLRARRTRRRANRGPEVGLPSAFEDRDARGESVQEVAPADRTDLTRAERAGERHGA